MAARLTRDRKPAARYQEMNGHGSPDLSLDGGDARPSLCGMVMMMVVVVMVVMVLLPVSERRTCERHQQQSCRK